MDREETLNRLTDRAVKRHERSIELLTTFLQEASCLVLVFGILDTFASNKLTWRVGGVVTTLGTVLFLAAFSVRYVCFRIVRMLIEWSLTIQE